jgi:serine O-acetyltransferase
MNSYEPFSLADESGNSARNGAEEPPRGDTDENPRGIGVWALVLEDFRTHDRNPFEPGFWAVATHRFGNWRMGLRPRFVRAPFTIGYRFLHTSINWLWGIDLGYTVKVGRRVRLWHHGGMVLSARSIGDDVHIRHNTTMGIARRSETTKRPTIENGVDIGVGACILGDVTVGHDSVVGANAVVVTSFPPHSTIAGVPAKAVAKSGRPQEGTNGKASRFG